MKIELQIDQIINTYVPAISNGDETIDSVLIRYPQIAAELRPRLEAALWLHQVKQTVAPRPGFICFLTKISGKSTEDHATPNNLAAFIQVTYTATMGS